MEVVKKKIKPGKVEVAEGEAALVVHYFKESTYEDGSTQRTHHTSKVPVRFGSRPDVARMAAEIIDDCKYLSPSRQETVQNALLALQRQLEGERKGAASTGKDRDRDAKAQRRANGGSGGGGDQRRSVQDDLPPANIHDVDEYLELLYETSETMTDKIRGTAMIVKLCRNVSDLEVLIQNNSLMALLSRLLREEYKKSMEMCYNILRICLSFSNFVEMHSLLSEFKIGALTMRVLDFEVTRAQHQREETKRIQAERDRAQRLAADEAAAINDKHRKELSKMKVVRVKSEKIVYVCLYLLINLADDVTTERKMLKKKLLPSLVVFLELASTCNLMIMTVAFLKKLSLFEENKSAMAELGVVPLLVRLTPSNNDTLTTMCLRLLFNLSFDSALRNQMVQGSLVPKLVSLLREVKSRALVLRLLYHLSVEDRVKSLFTYTDAIAFVMELVINFPMEEPDGRPKHVAKELVALAVNLSLNDRNAELMCHHRGQHQGLYELVERMERTHDPLLMKVVRNLSQWTRNVQEQLTDPAKEYKQRGMWGRFVDSLLRIAVVPDLSHDVLVEVLGCLANLTMFDLPRARGWVHYISEFNLLSFMSRLLVAGMSQHDVVLEVVMLVGTMLDDQACVALIASSDFIRYLQEVWRDKGDDSEIKLQLLHTYYKLLLARDTREELLFGTADRAFVSIMDCLSSRHPSIRDAADQCLDLVHEIDRRPDGSLGELGNQISKQRFRVYNREWLDVVERGDELGRDFQAQRMADLAAQRSPSRGMWDEEESGDSPGGLGYDDDYATSHYFMQKGGARLGMDVTAIDAHANHTLAASEASIESKWQGPWQS